MITGNDYFTQKGIKQAFRKEFLKKRERAISTRSFCDVTLKAHVNYGRWIVSCPSCNSSEFYFDDKFFCSECKNSWVNGKLCHVELPKDIKEIEFILEKRMIKNQNWNNESMETLRKENLEHEVK